jgi:hypothetical protein
MPLKMLMGFIWNNQMVMIAMTMKYLKVTYSILM